MAALTKDAERYRWLRSRIPTTIIIRINPECEDYRSEKLDELVDVRMGVSETKTEAKKCTGGAKCFNRHAPSCDLYVPFTAHAPASFDANGSPVETPRGMEAAFSTEAMCARDERAGFETEASRPLPPHIAESEANLRAFRKASQEIRDREAASAPPMHCGHTTWAALRACPRCSVAWREIIPRASESEEPSR
jgi:hypothetical protein